MLIVPVMLDDEPQPDYRYMDAAVAAIAPGVHAGSLVIFETTLPVGDTRGRYAPRLARPSGLTLEEDFFVAFSPERLYSGSALRNLATYPKLVGGLGPASTARAAAFYDSVLDAEVVAMTSAEAAEFASSPTRPIATSTSPSPTSSPGTPTGSASTSQEVIAAANSQPYSHIHQPGLGVGGHCIPVYPHFLLDRAPEMELVAQARRINDGQVGPGAPTLAEGAGRARGRARPRPRPDLPDGVKELAYSRALPLIERLVAHGAQPLAYDPLLTAAEIGVERRDAVDLGRPRSGRRAIVTQTADAAGSGLDVDLVPGVAAHRRRPELAPRPRSPGTRRLSRHRWASLTPRA